MFGFITFLKIIFCCYTPCLAKKPLGDQIREAHSDQDSNEEKAKSQMTEIMKVVTDMQREMQNMNQRADKQNQLTAEIMKIMESMQEKIKTTNQDDKTEETDKKD